MRITPAYIFFLCILSLASCKKDVVIPACQYDPANTGQICREIVYQDNKLLGYIDYKYNNIHLLITKQFNSIQNTSKTESFTYNANNQIIRFSTLSENGTETGSQTFGYSGFDSLVTITSYSHAVETSVFTMQYDSLHFLSRKDISNTNGNIYSVHYEYDDNKRIYKTLVYNASDVLLSFKLYYFYSNNILKVFNYDAGTNPLGYEVIVTDDKGNLLEDRQYDSLNNIVVKMVNVYLNGKMITKSRYEFDVLVSYSEYQYN